MILIFIVKSNDLSVFIVPTQNQVINLVFTWNRVMYKLTLLLLSLLCVFSTTLQEIKKRGKGKKVSNACPIWLLYMQVPSDKTQVGSQMEMARRRVAAKVFPFSLIKWTS